ncbi:MAG TPA: hypothetical protein V6D22_14650 [Candidatus Obscuribacterales bacterium]
MKLLIPDYLKRQLNETAAKCETSRRQREECAREIESAEQMLKRIASLLAKMQPTRD